MTIREGRDQIDTMPTPEQLQQARWFELAFEWGGLHRASFFGDRDRVLYLLAAGEDAEYRALDQWRPIDVAARNGDLVIVREFVNVGVIPDVHTLLAAVGGGSVFVTNEILNAGVPLEAAYPEPRGETALMTAAREGHTDLIRHLARLGAAIDRTESFGSSAVHYAASGGHGDAVRALVTAGANVDLADKDGRRPIQSALKPGRDAAARALIEGGASMPDVRPTSLIHTLVQLGDLALLQCAFDRWSLADHVTKKTVRRARKGADGTSDIVDFLHHCRSRSSSR